MKVTKYSIAILGLVLLLAGCGGNSSSSPIATQPLDPQGNWLFTLTDANNASFSFAGQLFELTPPVVTGNNGMAVVGPNPRCGFSITLNGQASGTNAINLTLSAIDTNTPPAYTLTGTIATDQAHMSGTFTATQQEGCTSTPTGTWTASQIPAITATWTGTSGDGAALSAVVTENTDQTTPNMGALTGNLTVGSGSQCVVAGTYAFTAPVSVHVGEIVVIAAKDSAGTALTAFLTVDPSTNNSAPGNVSYAGGPCTGQTFSVTLSHP